MKKAALLSIAFIALAGVAFAGGKSDSSPAASGKTQPKVIKISTGLNEQHPLLISENEFKKIIESRLPGKYDIQIYANAQLGDDVRATEAVRMGTLEMVATTASPVTGLIPELNVFDLPFIITSEKGADAIFDGPVGAKFSALLETKGFKNLCFMENGFRQLTNSAREVKSPADLKGLKVRTMQNPLHLAAWKALGANPTPMAFSEVFTAMQQKTIDGQENPIPTIYLQKFNEVQKYCTLSGHIYSPFLFLINKKLFDSFPAEDQKVFLEAAAAASKFERELNRKMNSEMVDKLRAAGMVVTELTPAQIKVFQDATKSVYDEWVPKIGKDLVAEFQATVAGAK